MSDLQSRLDVLFPNALVPRAIKDSKGPLSYPSQHYGEKSNITALT